MSNYHSPLDQLNALTLEGIDVLARLKSQLDVELAALTERDLDKVKSINTEKQATLAEFDQNNQLRATCLLQAGFEVSKASITALLEASDSAELQKTFRANWKQIEKMLNQTMEYNKRNEIVLTRNRQNLEQLLSVLRGHTKKNTLYDAKGGKGNYSGQSRLGKA